MTRQRTDFPFSILCPYYLETAMTFAFEKIDTALTDVEALPWMPFTPYTDEAFLKLLKVNPVTGEWITLLKIPGYMQLPKHHHSGTVIVYTISGSWRYLEHDWIATQGSLVCETAGTQHTPAGVGDDEVCTLNIVMGDWNLIGPEGQVLAIENWKTMMQRYLDFCRANGIEAQDVSSFEVQAKA